MNQTRYCGRLGCRYEAHAIIHVSGKGERVVCVQHTEANDILTVIG